jgi:hypothetical protein
MSATGDKATPFDDSLHLAQRVCEFVLLHARLDFSTYILDYLEK